MSGLRDFEARKVLAAYCLQEDGKPASTFQITKEMRREGASDVWFLENTETCPPWDGPRTRAYLKAYAVISDERFYGTGIPVHNKYLQPDRAVIKSLLLAGCVEMDKIRILLTDRGQELCDAVPTIPLNQILGT